VTTAPLVKIQAATAAEICANFALKKDLLAEGMSPQQFLAALLENKKCVDAIDFIAHALPLREAVWWGCLCMQHALGDQLSPAERSAATAVVQWVMQPSEEARAAAKALAEQNGPGTPAGALAMAVGQAAPGPAAKFVAMAVKIASTKAEPVKMEAVQKSYVELAAEIAEGRFLA
jgi:hypothetical protein